MNQASQCFRPIGDGIVVEKNFPGEKGEEMKNSSTYHSGICPALGNSKDKAQLKFDQETG